MKFVKILVYAAVVLFVAACENDTSLTEKGKQALAENKADQAAEYFSKAVELKNAEAARLLGMLYADGNGVDKQPEKAVELYSSASEWGDSLATYLLAGCYENGVGTKADLTKSVMLYEKCAQSYPEAYGKLADLYFRGGDNFEVDWGKAYANSEKADLTKDSDALAINGFFFMRRDLWCS